MSPELQRIQTVIGVIVIVAVIVGAVFAYIYLGVFGVLAVGALVGWVLLEGIATDLPGWIQRAKLRRRAREGRCLHCGYDLRGNPQSKLCPECGKPTAQAAAT